MKLIFDYKFRLYTSRMNEFCLHYPWLYFSSIISSFGHCVLPQCAPSFLRETWWAMKSCQVLNTVMKVEGHFKLRLFNPKLQPQTFEPRTFQTWTFQPQTFQPQSFHPWTFQPQVWGWNVLLLLAKKKISTLDFPTLDFLTPLPKNSWLKSSWLKG